MTVENMLMQMSGPEIDMWFAFYELEAEDRARAESTPKPFEPRRRTIGR